MGNNKVSEKAVWEGSISPDNDTPPIGSQMQAQPQMMFCYKCNNVIPANSKFCPCCNIELYTTCPKCGVKYSSQYLICNQCGTNREEFLQMQRREAERKAAIERENRRRQEILEKEKREREQEEALKRWQHQEAERKQEEAYLRKNAEIMKTKEYETTYSLMKEALETYNKKMMLEIIIGTILTFAFVGILIVIHALVYGSPSGLEKFLLKYVSEKNGDAKDMAIYIIDDIKPIYSGLYSLTPVKDLICYLPECCIIAYRKKHKLPINYKWHNLK